MSDSTYEKLSQSRKKEQTQGKYPHWFTTGGYQMFKETYEYKSDGYSEQIKRIANHMAKFAKTFPDKNHEYYDRLVEHYGNNWEDVFYNLMWTGHHAPSTPVLSNGGTDRGCTVSCSGSYVHDSIDGFYSSRHEAALLAKEGFGTSAYLGGIRPRGTSCASGNTADGSLPVLLGFARDAKDVSQAGVRRGSWAGYIEITHPDFDEWADYLHKNPQGLNIGWITPKSWIEACESGDEEAIRRFKKALHVKMITGKGYFWKVDHVNEQQPEMYKDLGLTNKASNLC